MTFYVSVKLYIIVIIEYCKKVHSEKVIIITTTVLYRKNIRISYYRSKRVNIRISLMNHIEEFGLNQSILMQLTIQSLIYLWHQLKTIYSIE